MYIESQMVDPIFAFETGSLLKYYLRISMLWGAIKLEHIISPAHGAISCCAIQHGDTSFALFSYTECAHDKGLWVWGGWAQKTWSAPVSIRLRELDLPARETRLLRVFWAWTWHEVSTIGWFRRAEQESETRLKKKSHSDTQVGDQIRLRNPLQACQCKYCGNTSPTWLALDQFSSPLQHVQSRPTRRLSNESEPEVNLWSGNMLINCTGFRCNLIFLWNSTTPCPH